jgi:hypothetical protein
MNTEWNFNIKINEVREKHICRDNTIIDKCEFIYTTWDINIINKIVLGERDSQRQWEINLGM